MSPAICQWAKRHGISELALRELRDLFGLYGSSQDDHSGKDLDMTSESAVQATVRLDAARKGVKLFRNNVGALLDARGVPVRYGLANDSKKINEVVKSSDLIGWRTVLIGQEHVGQGIAQFVSRECKYKGWHYTGRDREIAQLAWLQLVVSGGGDAAFCTGVGTFDYAKEI